MAEIEKEIELLEQMERLRTYDGSDRVLSSHEMVKNLGVERPPAWVAESLFFNLDDKLKGFLPGETTVVSGVTGEGKTTFCRTLTKNFAMYDHPSLWFSYEEIPREFIAQFGDKPPLFYLPNQMRDITLNWIRERILEGIEKYRVRIVFIDHLHYLIDLVKGSNVSLHVGQIMRGIVGLAKELNVHIFMVAHMKKVEEGKEPGKGDARDSSLVEQEPHNVFYIWRRGNPNEGKGYLKVAKNRRRGVWNYRIPIVKNGYFFEEDFNATPSQD